MDRCSPRAPNRGSLGATGLGSVRAMDRGSSRGRGSESARATDRGSSRDTSSGSARGTDRGSLRPPAPSRCSARASLRAPYRGDPPRRAGRRRTARIGSAPPAWSHHAFAAYPARGAVACRPKPPLRCLQAQSRRAEHQPEATSNAWRYPMAAHTSSGAALQNERARGADWRRSRPGSSNGSDDGKRGVASVRGSAARVGSTCRPSREQANRDHTTAAQPIGTVRRRLSTSRGVAPVRSAQRGTSGAATGGGGPQAPPIRTTFRLPNL
jgi:hypothetical protein